MSFHDIDFPLSLAFGASGGPTRQTEITELASGAEHRNSPHAHSRRRYNAGLGIKSLDDLSTVIAFFEARRGSLFGFRFRDPVDHLSCGLNDTPSPTDQDIGTGDGQETRFALVKNYADAQASYARPITKPVISSVRAAINGSEQAEGTFSVDAASGALIFNAAPPEGASITAGYVFDVPVRFDTDQIELTLESFGAGQMATIPLLELRAHA